MPAKFTKSKSYKNNQEGIEERKAASKREFERRSKLKKNLSKLLKEEGFEEDVTDRTKTTGRIDKDSLIKEEEEEEVSLSKGKQKQQHSKQKNKTNPFGKSIRNISELTKEREEKRRVREMEIQSKSEERRVNFERRKDVHIKLSKKTKKGQPIMSYKIDSLLAKLQSTT